MLLQACRSSQASGASSDDEHAHLQRKGLMVILPCVNINLESATPLHRQASAPSPARPASGRPTLALQDVC